MTPSIVREFLSKRLGLALDEIQVDMLFDRVVLQSMAIEQGVPLEEVRNGIGRDGFSDSTIEEIIIMMDVEKEFGIEISDVEASEIKTVEDLIAIVIKYSTP